MVQYLHILLNLGLRGTVAWDEHRRHKSQWKRLTVSVQAGAFAAVSVDFLVYPFDTLKTRIQSPNYERVFKDVRTGAVKRNVLFRGLYQGVWSVVFSTIPSCKISCSIHGSFDRLKVTGVEPKSSFPRTFLCSPSTITDTTRDYGY